MTRKRDPLDPQNLAGSKWHHPQTTRPSTRKSAAPKTVGDLHRGNNMHPSLPRSDPYRPKPSEIQGYSPAWRDAISAVEAGLRRDAAKAKKGRKP